jgi:hypothetical protein
MNAINDWLNQYPPALVYAGFFLANFTITVIAGLLPTYLYCRRTK